MARDWDAEWEVLIAAERSAFESMMEATAPVMAVFRKHGAPSLDLLDTADGARARWNDAKARIDRFITEFRAAP